ncbi:helix-turn-helix transcriptional regulator [Halococcus sp. AFM35]|uniref:helix-turn-helix transcriptional regulator n=1 Tax=Halococcus sp. AFM35 TaxID=3421653 RepID=UPI003EB6BD3D
MDQPLDDIEFLSRSEHRVKVLDAVAEHPRSRTDLRALTGASSSTIGRMLGEFEERYWVERVGHRYEATSLGAFVAEGMLNLLERMETERTLREVWQWLPTEEIGFDVESFADAVVTVPEFGSPDRTVSRFAELVEETKTIRGFTTTTVTSDMEVLFRNAIEGMETELLWPSDLTETVLASHPEQARKAIENGDITILINDGLPCACAIFDDRVGLAGYDRETGIMRATIDTDAPEARRWAEALYESYRRDARPLDPEAIVA